jgi:hypothetical protein
VTDKSPPDHDGVVFPVHLLDQSALQQELVTWVLSFNDVLSAACLHQSLCALLEIGDWKKLGTRLRIRVSFATGSCAGEPRTMDN